MPCPSAPWDLPDEPHLGAAAPDDGVRRAYVTIWRELLRHDETLAARALIGAAPHAVRAWPVFREIALATERATVNVSSASAYQQWNVGKVSPALSMHPADPVKPEKHTQEPRYAYVRDQIAVLTNDLGRPLRMADVATQDGWLAVRLARELGCRVLGIDIHVGMLTLANMSAAVARVEGCQWLHGDACDAAQMAGVARDHGPFDAVVCCELFEHVLDPRALGLGLAALVGEGAPLLLTTPLGSWHAGAAPVGMEDAPDWWLLPRDHCRAPCVGDVLDALGAGFALEAMETRPTRYAAWKDRPGGVTLCCRLRRLACPA